MRILVTGGAGYIGTHTCVELLAAGHDLTVIDNLVNSKEEALRRVEAIAGRSVTFRREDLLNRPALDRVIAEARPEAVIHFAALKAVGESVSQPVRYYTNNVTGTLNLCASMAEQGVRTLLFSSSATVYGIPDQVPIREEAPLRSTNPYGWSKVMMEQVLLDVHRADPAWRIGILRYFNPVGAHASGTIGEDPTGVPNNLFPYVTQVAVGMLDRVRIYGGDYSTPDGTGVRDYIHVEDLAVGHVQALDHLVSAGGVQVCNLGTGRGHSVLEVLAAFERVVGRPIPHEIVARRPGDVAECFADPGRARALLGWEARHDLDRMCADAWRWQSANPTGYP